MNNHIPFGDLTTRTKIVELKLVAGWTYNQIHEEYPLIALSIIIKKQSIYMKKRLYKCNTCSQWPLTQTCEEERQEFLFQFMATYTLHMKISLLWLIIRLLKALYVILPMKESFGSGRNLSGTFWLKSLRRNDFVGLGNMNTFLRKIGSVFIGLINVLLNGENIKAKSPDLSS